jgi:hypothetical protein
MRAEQILKTGSPDVIQSVELPQPVAKSGEVVVRVKAVFFYVDVTTERLDTLTKLFDSGDFRVEVGTVLPLDQAPRRTRCWLGRLTSEGK